MVSGTQDFFVRVKIEPDLDPLEYQIQVLEEQLWFLHWQLMRRNQNNWSIGSKVKDLESLSDIDSNLLPPVPIPAPEPVASAIVPVPDSVTPTTPVASSLSVASFPPPVPTAKDPAQVAKKRILPKRVRPNIRIKYPVKEEPKDYQL